MYANTMYIANATSTPVVIRIDPNEMPLPVHSRSESSPPSASFEIVCALL